MSAAPEIALYSGGSPLGISPLGDRKSTRLNSSHDQISYAVFCLKKKKNARRENQKAHAHRANTLVPLHPFAVGRRMPAPNNAPLTVLGDDVLTVRPFGSSSVAGLGLD